AAIFAGRRGDTYLCQADFDAALERVVAGLQQKKVLTEKERRILSYHEGGHALMAHLMGAAMELQKVTIVSRGEALGYAFYLPEEDRYLHTKEELIDWIIVTLAGRAAEEVVFGRVTNGAANDLEKVTEITRSMVFDWGMADTVSSRTMRADNYALSEETTRLRDSEQSRRTSAISGHASSLAPASTSRASRWRPCTSAGAASSCSRRSPTTRRWAGSSPVAGRECTTSRTRWRTSASPSATSSATVPS